MSFGDFIFGRGGRQTSEQETAVRDKQAMPAIARRAFLKSCCVAAGAVALGAMPRVASASHVATVRLGQSTRLTPNWGQNLPELTYGPNDEWRLSAWHWLDSGSTYSSASTFVSGTYVCRCRQGRAFTVAGTEAFPESGWARIDARVYIDPGQTPWLEIEHTTARATFLVDLVVRDLTAKRVVARNRLYRNTRTMAGLTDGHDPNADVMDRLYIDGGRLVELVAGHKYRAFIETRSVAETSVAQSVSASGAAYIEHFDITFQ